MPRARRTWSDIRDEIRRLLRETTAANSFWTDAQLKDFFNTAIDERVMEMATVDESWVTDEYFTSIVANQREYPLPEGAGRVKRVMLLRVQGSRETEVPLTRDDRWSRSTVHGEPTIPFDIYRPTYRLLGNLLLLEPRPTESRTNGLRIDLESAPARIDADGDQLDLRFPDIMETLLVYETACMALAQRQAQEEDGGPPVYAKSLFAVRDRLARQFSEYITDRTEGRVAGPGLHLGD